MNPINALTSRPALDPVVVEMFKATHPVITRRKLGEWLMSERGRRWRNSRRRQIRSAG